MTTEEYVFILPDGQKRYEIIDTDSDLSKMLQIVMLMKMHGAITALPVKNEAPPA